MVRPSGLPAQQCWMKSWRILPFVIYRHLKYIYSFLIFLAKKKKIHRQVLHILIMVDVLLQPNFGNAYLLMKLNFCTTYSLLKSSAEINFIIFSSLFDRCSCGSITFNYQIRFKSWDIFI